MALVDWELLGDTKGAAGRQDRDLGDRVRMLRQESNEGVPSFVDGNGLLLFGESAFEASRRPSRTRSLASSMSRATMTSRSSADCHDGGLVDQVGQICPRESGSGAGDGIEVDVGTKVLALAVHGQDGGPLGLVGEGNLHLSVEATRSEQGRIEHLGPVGGGHDDHPGAWGRSRPSRPGAG